MKMINIPIHDGDYFHKCLLFLNPLFKLRKQELEILAELLSLYWEFGYLNKELRDKTVFDYDNKIKIVNKLNISKQSFDNNITSLRKKNIVKGRSIPDKILSMINPNEKMIVIKFTDYGQKDNS